MSWRNDPTVTPTKPKATPKSTSWRSDPTVKRERSLLDTAGEAIQNIPESGAEFVKGMAEAVLNPIDTAGAMFDLAAGTLNRAMPAPVREFINKFDTDPAATKRAVQTAQQVGGMYRQRYGSAEAIKRTIATDPVGAAADLSTILSGGAGAVRAGGKVAARVAPGAAPKLARTADVLTKAAARTNPVNAMAPAAKVVPKVIQRVPVAVQNFMAPKQTAALAAAEGRAPELIKQLRRPDLEIVPGSKPTAAQAASPLGITQFSALGASAEKADPSLYLARDVSNEAARSTALRGVAGTADELKAAKEARTAAAQPLYKQADKVLVAVDKKFTGLLDRPSMGRVLARASELAAEKGVPFQIGKNRPEQTTPSKILNAEGQPMGSITIPGETAKYPGSSLHMMKLAFDDLIKNPERFGIGATEANAIGKTRADFLNWVETKVPPYKTARTTFAEKSKPINQMEVGQYLQGKLEAPLEAGGERANVFATAIKDAPGTLKRATNNQVRFEALSDILTPDQVRVVEAIRDDLSRAMATKTQARKGAAAAPDARAMASAASEGARPPQFLSRVATVASDIMSRLRGKIDRKLAIQIAAEMVDPEAAAALLEKAVKGQRRAQTIGGAGAATVNAMGKGLRSPAALAAERTQNAMAEAEYPTLVLF